MYFLPNNLLQFTILLCFLMAIGQPESKAQQINQTINSNWLFFKGDTAGREKVEWERISLPHSFNTHDVMDDEPGYYRGKTWYKKTVHIPGSWSQKVVYLHFEGANQVATVFLNGKKASQHTGGYNGFNVCLNDHLQLVPGGTTISLAVQVDNSFDPNIPTLTADFTFFGGIYRDVMLNVYEKVHFRADDRAARSLYLSTPTVSAGSAKVMIRGEVANVNTGGSAVTVTHTLLDRNGRQVARKEQALKLKVGNTPISCEFASIPAPHLWTPEDPYLYRVVSTIRNNKTKEVLDELTHPLGFRWYQFTADKGFFLNSKPYKLWGASRHQDNMLMGNALSDALHVKDLRLLKEMGANFLRVAHYPQDPAILEACDRLGVLASVEVPIVNTITESEAFYHNSKEMQVEMVRQNFNHPSVIMWTYMNEVLLKAPFKGLPKRQEIYYKNVVNLARSIDSLLHKEDPYRYTMLVFSSNYDLFKRIGLLQVPQVVGWNLYNGWYTAGIEKFGEHIDRHHKEFPQTPILITEYGADGDPRIRSLSPERFDKSLEYETYFHKEYIKAISSRAYVSGGIAWNLADFNSETREEAMPHINNKGLLDIDRQPKDVYHLYQSFLLKKPFLSIGSRSWTLRSGIAESEEKLSCRQQVEIYTNQQSDVTLNLNGRTLGSVTPKEGVAAFEVPFSAGVNHLEAAVQASGNTIKDVADINFLLLPSVLKSAALPFSEINVSLGDNRYFIDDKSHQVWIPEKEYKVGSWGYVGGEVYRIPNSTRHPYGSDKNILGTDYDPIYETQRAGIKEFRFDVPDGRYDLTLHFAELISDTKREALVYNLDNKEVTAQKRAERTFDVLVNNVKMIDQLGSNNYLIPETAYSTRLFVDVKDGKGIRLQFVPLKGDAILNGIQLRKIY
ncbi:glycoside hydrolase family 2 TIM barrel-domain containing protein [Pedobacter heparinus]|uniref:glycoside hydrolase family 2 TIM barrel-domain containing protein n=1 Tax=Pedobacter heparinus TaxID=984 RepID=UPI002931BE11|nr:glycoside hydrolase family 2 TIM barrel-domain containing protein [Pedobacter heparinus]